MNTPSVSRLREILEYDHETGHLTWKRRDKAAPGWNGRYAGKAAFTSDSGSGYRVGAADGRKLYAHRVAWAIHYGEWPDIIDHINGDRSDNRLANIRNVCATENARNCSLKKNNQSGFHGVTWSRQFQKWRATITVNRKSIHIGLFDTSSEAMAARATYEREAGFHHNHGRLA